jgi:hypothetical protein
MFHDDASKHAEVHWPYMPALKDMPGSLPGPRPPRRRFYPPVPPVGVQEPFTQQQGAAAGSSYATSAPTAEGKPTGGQARWRSGQPAGAMCDQ